MDGFIERKQIETLHGEERKAKVINIGLVNFYNSLLMQNVEATQINWHLPIKPSKEISDMLDLLM